MEVGAIVVFIVAFAGFIFYIGGFNDLIQRRNNAMNQPWRNREGHE